VAAFDLGRFRTLVDLGGATGHLALAACEHYPEMRAMVFDLPGVIERVRQYAINSPAADRVTFVPGDFFQDPLPEADLFAMGRILHDWREEKIRLLLRRIWERLPSGGGVLIVEKLLNDDKSGPLPALLQSLNMLVCTEGQERTLAEYTSLLRDAGFAGVRGARTGQPLDAVLALKA
jgi:acetylserotonin N-methyltransferase